MPAGNEDLNVNDDNYFKIDDSALGATQQVGKKDSVNIGNLRALQLALRSPSPRSPFHGTFPKLPVMRTRALSTGPWRAGEGYAEDCNNLLEAALLKLVQPR